VRFTPKNMDDVKKCLDGRRDDMNVKVQPGVPLDANTVADLRSLTTWPPDCVLVVHRDPDPRFSEVKVERA
jgi:hypothetical protein